MHCFCRLEGNGSSRRSCAACGDPDDDSSPSSPPPPYPPCANHPSPPSPSPSPTVTPTFTHDPSLPSLDDLSDDCLGEIYSFLADRDVAHLAVISSIHRGVVARDHGWALRARRACGRCEGDASELPRLKRWLGTWRAVHALLIQYGGAVACAAARVLVRDNAVGLFLRVVAGDGRSRASKLPPARAGTRPVITRAAAPALELSRYGIVPLRLRFEVDIVCGAAGAWNCPENLRAVSSREESSHDFRTPLQLSSEGLPFSSVISSFSPSSGEATSSVALLSSSSPVPPPQPPPLIAYKMTRLAGTSSARPLAFEAIDARTLERLQVDANFDLPSSFILEPLPRPCAFEGAKAAAAAVVGFYSGVYGGHGSEVLHVSIERGPASREIGFDAARAAEEGGGEEEEEEIGRAHV